MHNTSDVESTKKSKWDHLSNMQWRQDLRTIDVEVAEICVSVAESSFPGVFWQIYMDRNI